CLADSARGQRVWLAASGRSRPAHWPVAHDASQPARLSRPALPGRSARRDPVGAQRSRRQRSRATPRLAARARQAGGDRGYGPTENRAHTSVPAQVGVRGRRVLRRRQCHLTRGRFAPCRPEPSHIPHRARLSNQPDWGSLNAPRLGTDAEGGGTTGPMSPSGASSRSTITGAWSLGRVPLRAWRSTQVARTRLATAALASTRSMRIPRSL